MVSIQSKALVGLSSRLCFGVVCFAVLASLPAAAGEPEQPDPVTLIKKLSDDNFDVRSAASEKLAEMGEKARGALEAVAQSSESDIETRFGVSRLLSRLSRTGLVYHLIDRAGKPVPNIDMTVEMYEMNDPYRRGATPATTITTNASGTARLASLQPGQFSVNTNMLKCWPAGDAYNYGGTGRLMYQTLDLRAMISPRLMTVTQGGAVKGKVVDADGKPLKDATFEVYHCAYFNPRMFETTVNDGSQRQAMGNAISGADGVASIEKIGDGVCYVVATMAGYAPAIGPLVRIREGQTLEVPPLTLTPRPTGKIVFTVKGVPLTPEEIAETSTDKEVKSKRQQLESFKNSIKSYEENLAKLEIEIKAAEDKKAEAAKTESGKTATETKAPAADVKRPASGTPAARKTNLEVALNRSRDRVKVLEEEIAKITADKIKEEVAKKPKKDPNEPDVLKKVKLFVDNDFVFEGPDGEKRNRAALILKMQRTRWNRNPQNDTGEDGVVTLDNLRPGKYRVRIKAEQYAARTMEAQVGPGGTVNLGEIVLDHGGSVSGSALMSDGKTVTDLIFYPIREDPEATAEMPQEVLGYIQGSNTWEEARSYLNWQRQYDGNSRYVDPKDPNKFLLKNLAPGTYSLLIACISGNRFEQSFLVCGVKIEAGKATELAPLKFTTTPTGTSTTNNTAIKGKVTGGDSDSYTRGQVYYQYGNGTSSTSLNADGTFTLHTGNGVLVGKLRVKVSGYKMAELDTSKPGVDLNNIEIKLEKIKYGGVRVKVVDEEGNAIAGAKVNPSPNAQNNWNYNYNQQFSRRVDATNIRGEAMFTGLSIGSRTIEIIKDGYFNLDPFQVVVLPDQVTTLTAILRKGYTLKGMVVAPQGRTLDAERTVISIQGKKSTSPISAGVNAAGEFEISGLNPDTYAITATSVLCVSLVGASADLTKGSVNDFKVELISSGGIALQLDEKFRGRAVSLIDKDTHEMKAVPQEAKAIARRAYSPGSSYTDQTGRVEFFEMTAGEYYIAASHARNYYGTDEDDSDAMYTRKVKCEQYVGPIKIDAVKPYTAILADPATKIEFPEASASATVRFEFNEPPVETQVDGNYSQRTFIVKIFGSGDGSGTGAGSRCTYSPPARRVTVSSKRTGLRVQVVGEMPAYFKPMDGGKTLIQNLMPGKYKMTFMTYLYTNGGQMQSPEQAVTEFEVKAGERKDLGAVQINPQKETINITTNAAARQMRNMPPAEEDLEEAFEP